MDCLNQSIIDESSDEDNNKQQPIQLQSVINKANGQGRYQFISFMIFGFMWFVTAWLLLGQSFFFDDSYQCHDQPDKQKCEQLVCSVGEDQRERIISTHADSIVFAFSQYLICDYEYIISVLQSILFIGSLSGFFAIPYMADNWGRRIAVRISWGICTLGVIAICFADSPNMVGIGYFLSGFGCNPAITLTLSIINQETLGKSRHLYGVGVQVFFALGQAVIGFVFLSNLHWYQIGYVMAGLCLLINILILYIVQSPKFLIKYNKEGAYLAMNLIAKKNGRKQIKKQYFDRVQSKNQNAEDSGASIIDLFRYGSLRIITIATGLVFLAVQFIYYYVSLNLGQVGDSKAINQLIVSLSQAAGYIVSEFLISCVKRKIFSFIGMLISSIMCFAVGFLTMIQNKENRDTLVYAQTVSLLINRFVLSSAWAVFYIYVAQLYPTRVRSLGFGWVSAMGTIGSAVAPFAILTAENIGINTWLIPGAVGIIGTLAVIFCPQTFGKPLQDQILQRMNEQHHDKTDQQQDIFAFHENTRNKTQYLKHKIESEYILSLPVRSLQINNTPPSSPVIGSSQNPKISQNKSNEIDM